MVVRSRRAAGLGLPVAGVLLLGACGPAPHGTGRADDRSTPPPRPTAPSTGNPATDGRATGEPVTPCPPSGVRIRTLGINAAMGLRALGLELVNCGSDAYPLHGYPDVRLFDADGKPITVRVIEGATGITSGFDAPPEPLTLRPGERAGAAVLWRNLVTDPTVVATTGERMEVAPTASRPAQEAAPDVPVDLGNTGRIGVSAWKKLPQPTPSPTTEPPEPTRSTPLP